MALQTHICGPWVEAPLPWSREENGSPLSGSPVHLLSVLFTKHCIQHCTGLLNSESPELLVLYLWSQTRFSLFWWFSSVTAILLLGPRPLTPSPCHPQLHFSVWCSRHPHQEQLNGRENGGSGDGGAGLSPQGWERSGCRCVPWGHWGKTGGDPLPHFSFFPPLCNSYVLSYLLLSVLRTNCSSSLWHSVKEKLCMNWEGETFTLSSLSCLSHLASRLDGDARRTQEKLAKRALREPRALPPLHPARHSGRVPHGREVKSLKCCLIRFISAWQLFSELWPVRLMGKPIYSVRVGVVYQAKLQLK